WGDSGPSWRGSRRSTDWVEYMGRCPSIDQLEHALADKAGSSTVVRHLGHCAKCRARAGRIQANNSILADLRAGEPARLRSALEPARAPEFVAPAIEGYEIMTEMSRGGQGIVFKARQRATRRTVALKMLIRGPVATQRQRYRFEREIELAAGLR